MLKKNLFKNKKFIIILFAIIFLSLVIAMTLNNSKDMEVESCSVENSKYATCNDISNFNDGKKKTIGATIEKSGTVYLVMSNFEELTNDSVVNMVNLNLYHGGGLGISGFWTIRAESEDGTFYCEDNQIKNTNRPSKSYFDLTSCTDWTKEKLDSLIIKIQNSDTFTSSDAFIYGLYIDIGKDSK